MSTPLYTHEKMAQFTNWFKEQRAKRGISLDDVGHCLNVTPSTVKQWENTGVAYPYVRVGLQYFFEQYDKCHLYNCAYDEIPDSGKPQLVTGAWLSWWMETEGVKPRELAKKLDVTDSCVYRWMKSDTKLSIIAEYAIRQAMKTLTERNYIRDEVKSTKG